MAELTNSSALARMNSAEPATNILLVDDNPANLLSLRAILDELGQNLVEAASGEEALERLQTQEFAVVLLDVWMPGLNGFETAWRIRSDESSRHTPIIFLTAGDIEHSQIEKGYALGAVDFLVKPLSSVILKAKVRGFVELAQEQHRTRHEAEQLRLLVQGTTEYAIFMLDPSGRIATWNSGAERIKGYRAEEIIGEHLSRFYPPDAIARNWPQYELEMAQAEGRFEDEGWRLRKDGSRFWASVVITALRDTEGRLQGFSKVTRDLTRRKQAEEALRSSEERFRILVEGVKDYAIFLLDPEGYIVSWNPGAERIKQYRQEEIVGQHFSRFYPQEALDRGWPEYELQMARKDGRFEDEGWRVRKDGTQFWANVVITALRDEAGNLQGFSKITRDMTERMRAEENARRLLEESTARRVAEENSQVIQEQRERLRVTLASIGDGVISTDAQGRVEFLNPVAQELMGWKNEEALGRSLLDVFHIINEQTRDPVENPVVCALREGKIVGLANHTILISKDGTERPIDDSAAPIRDAAGNVVGSVLVFRDVSDRKRNQQALRESEGRFRGLMEQAPFSIQIFSPDGRTKRVNQAWEELWGANLEQIRDYNVLEDPQLDAKGILPYIRRAFAGEPVAIPAVQYDPDETIPDREPSPNAKRWVSAVAYPLKDELGHIREVILVHQDITQRKQAEEEREQFAFLVENSRDFIGMCDLNFVPWFVNREGLGLVGLESLDELREKAVAEFFFPEDRAFMTEQFFPQVLREGHGEVEIRFRHFKTGQPIWFAYSVVPILDTAGEPAGYATISRDITRLKEANLALRQADRRKDEFLALLAHELRNPLAPLRNGLQIMRLAQEDQGLISQTREVMDRQLTHMVRLIDDLLDVSRINRNKMELRRSRLLLTDAINSAVETARPVIDEAGHELTVSFPARPVHLDADLTRLAQVFANLLTNSAKYTRRGGRIGINAEVVGSEVLVTVWDTGIGIPRESLPTIFDMFSQVDRSIERSTGGLGIGLALVKGLVEMHGGTVQAVSPGEGQGSTFTVRLPVAMDHGVPALDRSLGTATSHQGVRRRILVVDDNRDAAVSMAMMLKLIGNEVAIAHDGMEAVETASQFRPQLILMDLGMPRLNGFDATHRIREQPWARDTVIIALTGWGKDEDRDRTSAVGCDGHLVKPVLLADLEALLTSLDK